jgi:DNA-binding CsgD family transcriptional regulator
MDLSQFITTNYEQYEIIQSMQIGQNALKISYAASGRILLQEGCQDAYMGMNTVGYIEGTLARDTKHIKRLKWLYMDLDTYKTAFNKQQIIMDLEENYYRRIIPEPTYVIDSGRGLYLLWRINENPKAAPRWKKVQNYLYSVLKDFGADRSVVTDQARVLRKLGTINSKSGTVVKALSSHPDLIYTLYEITQEYMLDKKEEKPQKTNIYFIGSQVGMLTARLKDLETLLLQYRDGNHAMRETILFLYRYWTLCTTQDKLESLKRTLDLNNKLQNPLSDKEATRATRSAEKYYDDGQTLRIRNKTLVELLGITEEEQLSLHIIISSDVKLKRKRIRSQKAYLESLEDQGKETKEVQITKRRNKLKELLSLGMTQKEICLELSISRSTFYDDKKALEESKEELSSPQIKEKEDTQKVSNLLDKNNTNNLQSPDCPEISALVLQDVSPIALFALPAEVSTSLHFDSSLSYLVGDRDADLLVGG